MEKMYKFTCELNSDVLFDCHCGYHTVFAELLKKMERIEITTVENWGYARLYNVTVYGDRKEVEDFEQQYCKIADTEE